MTAARRDHTVSKKMKVRRRRLAIWNVYQYAPWQWYATLSGMSQPKDVAFLGSVSAYTEAGAMIKMLARLGVDVPELRAGP